MKGERKETINVAVGHPQGSRDPREPLFILFVVGDSRSYRSGFAQPISISKKKSNNLRAQLNPALTNAGVYKQKRLPVFFSFIFWRQECCSAYLKTEYSEANKLMLGVAQPLFGCPSLCWL